jgi:hypothetical protein
MPTQFGLKPTSERVFVRVQHIAGDGKILSTQSMNVWQQPFTKVLSTVIDALAAAYGANEEDATLVEEAPIPIKGRVRRGRKA